MSEAPHFLRVHARMKECSCKRLLSRTHRSATALIDGKMHSKRFPRPFEQAHLRSEQPNVPAASTNPSALLLDFRRRPHHAHSLTPPRRKDIRIKRQEIFHNRNRIPLLCKSIPLPSPRSARAQTCKRETGYTVSQGSGRAQIGKRETDYTVLFVVIHKVLRSILHLTARNPDESVNISQIRFDFDRNQ